MTVFRSSRVAVAFLILLAAVTSVGASPLDNWTLRRTNSAETLMDVTYANGSFVAVGYNGVILTSPEGIDWTYRSSGVTDRIYRVTFCRDKFLAFTRGSTVLASSDGVTWSGVAMPAPTMVLWTNGLYVAPTGDSILTSTDSLSWSKRFSTNTEYLLDAAFGNGMYVVAGGENIVASPNGIDWVNTDHFWYAGSFLRATYGNNIFAVLGYFWGSAPSVVMTSTNGLEWTLRDPGGYEWLGGIAFGNGTLVAVGGPVYGSPGYIVTSEDTINWTQRNAGAGGDLDSVVYGRGTFVAVGALGTILQSDHYGPPFLTGRRTTVSNAFEVKIEAEAGNNFVVQSTTDCVNWSDAAVFTNAPSIVTFVDTAMGAPSRFYRTISK